MNFLLSIPVVKMLPTLMIVESLIASFIYAMAGKEGLKGATYWFAGALITYSVTWLK
jgi:hypothetical protein